MTTKSKLNPNRLKLARIRRQLTIRALAEEVGMSSRMISLYENGKNEHDIPAETIENIATALNFPIEFFFGEDIEPLDPDTVSFRSFKSMRAAQRDAALGAGSIAIHFSDWLDNNTNFKLPKTNLADLRGVDPETAASSLRSEWGLGVKSIRNMIHLLELHGVRIFSLSEENKEVDAFSFWKDNLAFVFLNTFKSAERSRFDAAHELGHLVLHKHSGITKGKEVESEADQFASAFLMPAESVKALAPRLPNLRVLIKLKKAWNVSLAALVRRLKDLGLISDWQYRSLNIEMSKSGMLRNEPDSIDREQSQLLTKVFSRLRDQGITKYKIAESLQIPIKEFENLVFGLAFIGSTVSDTKYLYSAPKERPTLKIVR